MSLPGDVVASLKKSLGGRLYLPGDEAYDQARGLPGVEGVGQQWRASWNHDAIGKPLGIASVQTTEEVQAVVNYTREWLLPARIPLAIACGRHSHQCMVDGSFVLDLSRLDQVDVDVEGRIAHVGGGAQQGQLDRACEPHGLATTAGHNATTGVGGLTLQGGHGYLERVFGLVVDNLLACEVVLASGEAVVADEDHHPDLFWALKGGGGNFGVVTKFSFRLHPFPREIYGGLRSHVPVWDLPWGLNVMLRCRRRADLVHRWCSNFEQAPREATGLLVLPCGGPVVESLMWAAENEAAGRAYFKDVHNLGTIFTLKNDMGMKKYHSDMQRISPVRTGHFYQSGVLMEGVSEEASAALCERLTSAVRPNAECAVLIVPLGGKAAEVDPRATANPHRSARFWVLIQGAWTPTGNGAADRTMRGHVVQWVRSVKAAMQPFAAGHYAVLADSAESNAAGTSETSRSALCDVHNAAEGGPIGMFTGRNVYGVNETRLRQLKRVYDAANLFRLNDNILPGTE